MGIQCPAKVNGKPEFIYQWKGNSKWSVKPFWLETTGEITKTAIRLKNKITEIHLTEISLVTAYHK